MSRPIPYYVVRNGRGYWQPTRKMRQLGFHSVRCGDDGATARTIARTWNKRWNAARSGDAPEADTDPPTPEEEGRGYVYFLRVRDRVKVGFSKRPLMRAQEMRTALSAPIDFFLMIPGRRTEEKAVHARLAAYRQSGEWFTPAAPVLALIVRCAGLGRVAIGPLAKDKDETKEFENFGARQP